MDPGQTRLLELSKEEYDNLLTYARKMVAKEPQFLLTEYDLVHEAIVLGNKDYKKAIKDLFYKERLLGKSKTPYGGKKTTNGVPGSRDRKHYSIEKICSTCKEPLPESAFYRVTDKRTNITYLESDCIGCCKEKQKNYYERIRDTAPFKARKLAGVLRQAKKDKERARNKIKEKLLKGKKVCGVCQVPKPAKAFPLRYNKEKKEYTLRGTCLECRAKITLKSYHRTKDKPEVKRKITERSQKRWTRIKSDKRIHAVIKQQKRNYHSRQVKHNPTYKNKQRAHSASGNALHRERMQTDPKYAAQFRTHANKRQRKSYAERKKAKQNKP